MPDFHYPGADNTAAIVTYAGEASFDHAIEGVNWSYNGTPTAGSLKVEDGGVVVHEFSITAGGPGFMPIPYQAATGQELKITLAAAGAVRGKLTIRGYRKVPS